jgi:hypothetical protein
MTNTHTDKYIVTLDTDFKSNHVNYLQTDMLTSDP